MDAVIESADQLQCDICYARQGSSYSSVSCRLCTATYCTDCVVKHIVINSGDQNLSRCPVCRQSDWLDANTHFVFIQPTEQFERIEEIDRAPASLVTQIASNGIYSLCCGIEDTLDLIGLTYIRGLFFFAILLGSMTRASSLELWVVICLGEVINLFLIFIKLLGEACTSEIVDSAFEDQQLP